MLTCLISILVNINVEEGGMIIDENEVSTLNNECNIYVSFKNLEESEYDLDLDMLFISHNFVFHVLGEDRVELIVSV